MRAGPDVRRAVLDTAHLLAGRGWVANHDGNVTARLGPDRYLATPTATAKARVTDRSLIEVDGEGQRVAGTARPFGELAMHLAVYRRRADVGAVVHAHPPHATAIACSAGNPIERPFIAEAVVSIGARIPKLPFAAPGPDAVAALVAVVGDVDAALLGNHGVMAWGADVEQAYLRLELVEHLARIAILAQPLGGIRPLPDDAIAPLLAKRARAGLGAAADRAEEQAAQVARPASAAPGPAGPGGAANLARIVREEIVRALRGDG